MPEHFTQKDYPVRFGWGPVEAAGLADPRGCLVVVDVLSFTTSVSVAVERGMAVYPYRWRDESAKVFAGERDAALAVGRRGAGPESPWSLSPAVLREAPAVARLVLPSPNGSTIAAAAGEGEVVAACLRNAGAVAAWLLAAGFATPERPVAVIASGERWPDGSLRPSLEDLLGAGAVLSGLGAGLSPEAAVAAAAYTATPDVSDAVRRCGSGIELVEMGFGADVDVAIEAGSTRVVPVLREGAFVDAGAH